MSDVKRALRSRDIIDNGRLMLRTNLAEHSVVRISLLFAALVTAFFTLSIGGVVVLLHAIIGQSLGRA